MFRWTPANTAWFVAWILMLIGIVVGLSQYRANAISTYGTSDAGVEWQTWRDAAEEMGNDGPVYRRPPKSTEPPPLVLMRDHFPACLGISLLLSSCLFGWLMICVRGAMKPVQLNTEADE